MGQPNSLQISSIDALTGLPTFVGLRSALQDPVAAIFLDIDGFRFLNGSHGHLAGDEVLSGLGAWLKRESEGLRGRAFRVAGEEFILLLPGRTLDEAATIAPRLVATCPTLPLPHEITVSAVVFLADQQLSEALRETLDGFAEQLYEREKTTGRVYGNLIIAG